ncbi:MAG: dihydrodipicolinate synthase family protein [Propioniciclava sp.]
MHRFSGIIPPLCTPLTADGRVDEASLRDLIEFQIDAGVSGIFVLGSSGEGIYLDDEQRYAVVRTATAAVKDRVPLLVGALAPTPRRVIGQISLLAALLPTAYVVTAPFYAQLSPSEIGTHFRQVAQAASAPVLAYDIPGNVGYKLGAEVTVPLLVEGVIAGLKDSSGDGPAFAAVVRALGDDRQAAVLNGADTTALEALAAGADGLIPGLANIRPDLFVDLFAAWRCGDTARSATLQRAVITLNQVFRIGQRYGLGRHAAEIGALKHALRRRGVITSPASPNPLAPYPAAAGAAVDAVLADVQQQLAAEQA